MPNLRHIIRALARTPLFTLTAVASLALGIGANTAMFSMLDRVLLRTLPVRAPHELAFLYHPGPTQGSTSTDEAGNPSFSYPIFRELQREQTAFTGLAASRSSGATIAYRGNASIGTALLVSGNYFNLLGVGPAIGRVLTDQDDRVPGGHPLVVLGHGYWRSRFGEDVSMLNQVMIVNGVPLTVVGVAQPGFTSEKVGSVPDLFIPISMKKELTPDWDALNDRLNAWITLFGRLKPGTTLEQADASLNATYRGQLEQDIAVMKEANQDFLKRYRAKKIVLKPGAFGRGDMRRDAGTPLMLLMGMTLLVLLIACANVANLQLARATARTREIAVRLALGASRGQLVRQLLTESCLIAVAGGVLGLFVAYWTTRGILASLPSNMAQAGIVTTDVDGRVLVFSLLLSVGTGLLFGLYPAWHASRTNLGVSLKDQNGQTTATWTTGLFRKTLVTLQMAISLLLLISAALFARTLINLTHVDLGLRSDHLITFSINPRLNRYTGERTVQFYRQLTERLSAVPGVTLVTSARVPALAGSRSSTSIAVEGFTPQKDGDRTSLMSDIGPDYFRTLDIPLVGGREFTVADGDPAAPKTVVVNEAFVRNFYAGQNPIGRRMSRNMGPQAEKVPQYDRTIIGVVKDAKYSDLREAVAPVFYTPYGQLTNLQGLYFYVRTAVEPGSLLTGVRAAVASLDPDLPLRDLRTMESQIDSRMAVERLLSRLTAIFGGLATLLAAIGLYGVLAYNVARRTREIGIRIALGAKAGHVRGLVMREVAVMLIIGTLLGVAAAGGVGTALQQMLFDVKPLDATLYLGAVGALAVVAALAAYLPARRATSVDPLVALRYE